MGLSNNNSIQLGRPTSSTHYNHVHKIFLLCNYILLGVSSGCVFLTLSLRLLPSPCGLLLIFIHALTVVGAASACATTHPAATARWHATHMIATVLTAIFQGAVAVLVFTRSGDFLIELRTYVQYDDALVILKMIGGLGIAVFCFEWMSLALAFVLRYNVYVEESNASYNVGARRSARVGNEEDLKDWPWPFQV